MQTLFADPSIKKHCIRRIQQRGGTHHPQVHRDEREKVG